MRLFLIRHCEAAPGHPDEMRALTAGGREAARALGEQLRRERLDAVVSSPLLRARETADAIAKAVGVEAQIDERLAPGATAEDLRAAVAPLGDTVAAVAHQPDCGIAVETLTGRRAPSFPPGGVEVLEL